MVGQRCLEPGCCTYPTLGLKEKQTQEGPFVAEWCSNHKPKDIPKGSIISASGWSKRRSKGQSVNKVRGRGTEWEGKGKEDRYMMGFHVRMHLTGDP